MDFEKIEAMTDAESQVFARQILSGNLSGDALSDVFLHLSVCGHKSALRDSYVELIQRKVFYPCEIYIYADYCAANSLIALLEKSNSALEINHILSCLSWIGTERVIDFLLRSDSKGPAWTKTLHVLPTKYSEVAGWTIDKQGRRVDLTSSKVICLGSDQTQVDAAVDFETFTYKDEECPFCRNKLITLFSVAPTIGESRVEFTTCLCCSCYNPVFMKIDQHGKSRWHEVNQRWEHLNTPVEMVAIEKNTLKAYSQGRLATFSISQFAPVAKSQIGGFPTWIQDSDYLSCPSCKSKMTFVGQIDMEDVMDFGEGIYYSSFCKHCNITGTNYQQS